jgi:hypothetical protein
MVSSNILEDNSCAMRAMRPWGPFRPFRVPRERRRAIPRANGMKNWRRIAIRRYGYFAFVPHADYLIIAYNLCQGTNWRQPGPPEGARRDVSLFAGSTGDSPVPPGHWPGGTTYATCGGISVSQLLAFTHGSGRRVAGRHRRVACAARRFNAKSVRRDARAPKATGFRPSDGRG